MYRLLILSVLTLATSSAIGQQQRQTIVGGDGSKTILDTSSGWTIVEKSGEKQTFTAADVTNLCGEIEKYPAALADKPDIRAVAFTCDEWWKLQPRTEIEKVPFEGLVRRLLLESRASTNFVRYRGMELKSERDSVTFVAAIIPNDLGSDVSCSVEATNRHELGMMYVYRCQVVTASFPAAQQLKTKLVQEVAPDLKSFGFKEDEVREHGLAVNARAEGACAPTGECVEGDAFVTDMKGWKFLQIDANPVLYQTARDLVNSVQTGRPAPYAVAPDKGSLGFEILSVGPLTKK